MAMRKGTRNELNKLRELTHHLLLGKKCYFCDQLLIDIKDLNFHGSAKGPPLEARICIHHLDENHENNALGNHTLAHESCHKSWTKFLYHYRLNHNYAFSLNEVLINWRSHYQLKGWL